MTAVQGPIHRQNNNYNNAKEAVKNIAAQNGITEDRFGSNMKSVIRDVFAHFTKEYKTKLDNNDQTGADGVLAKMLDRIREMEISATKQTSPNQTSKKRQFYSALAEEFSVRAKEDPGFTLGVLGRLAIVAEKKGVSVEFFNVLHEAIESLNPIRQVNPNQELTKEQIISATMQFFCEITTERREQLILVAIEALYRKDNAENAQVDATRQSKEANLKASQARLGIAQA